MIVACWLTFDGLSSILRDPASLVVSEEDFVRISRSHSLLWAHSPPVQRVLATKKGRSPVSRVRFSDANNFPGAHIDNETVNLPDALYGEKYIRNAGLMQTNSRSRE